MDSKGILDMADGGVTLGVNLPEEMRCHLEGIAKARDMLDHKVAMLVDYCLVNELSSVILSDGSIVPPIEGLFVNLEECTVTWNGLRVELTKIELMILSYLSRRPRIVRSRGELITLLYDHTAEPYERAIDSHIKRLRMKFRNVDPQFPHIHTVYSRGYCFIR